ncbi:PhzF family phenazine biosynthesis protein [Altererythrobacter sp. Root672]|uniref:PhzF family phenazine biosynthesis protein n=1 Tax=Altererythrobacter sp. Root672 TaxID=1736584 RepID=UPI0006F4EAB2|nr:PhzF family phenazine biosynthesis protein [Altererythrobacter sp. Root672]KRA81503.1 PhzF family phenazine biosynthesis protein [Altererythrobacter sp. Root672]
MSRTTLPYWHVDAFADRPFTGNQAAVMPLEEWLPDEVLRAIGEENNFAETAFVVPDASGEADWELRWFTPTYEIRLCGHATLASGHVLLGRDGGERVTFRTRKAGVLEVRRMADGGYELALPVIPTERQEWPEAAALLGITPLETWRNSDRYSLFLFENEDQVRSLKPDVRGLGQFGDDQFICTAPGRDFDVVSRVFVPGAGVDEDSVTGSAHALLTSFWAKRLGRSAFTAHQASARGGDLTCRLEGSQAWLGGQCVTVVEGNFYL